MARLDIERQQRIEPSRISHAKSEIEKLGYRAEVKESKKRVEFYFKGYLIYFYPYSGWASGVSIKDGRGLNNLLNQIRNR